MFIARPGDKPVFIAYGDFSFLFFSFFFFFLQKIILNLSCLKAYTV